MEKNAIWDLDGTLLDSLDLWYYLARRYLRSQKIRECEIPDDLEETVDAMTLEEAAGYLKEQFSLPWETGQIQEQFLTLVRKAYEQELPFFPRAREKVLELYGKGCRMCLLTTTESACARAALQRGGICHCFEAIYTCTDFGMSKREPEIYRKTCEQMRFRPEETMVYEDAEYALESAAGSGCLVTDAKNLWKNKIPAIN